MSWGHQNEPGEQQNVHRGTKMHLEGTKMPLGAPGFSWRPRMPHRAPKYTQGTPKLPGGGDGATPVCDEME